MDEHKLRRMYQVAHGPEASAAQRAAVATWDTLLAKDYAPRPPAHVPARQVARARYPVVDGH